MLTEETYDDFINWNHIVFMCFHNDKYHPLNIKTCV